MEGACLDKKSLSELSNLVEELQIWIESLELSNDQGFMESLKKSDDEVKKREFASWDEL